MKTGYIIGTNKQMQDIRSWLVKEGFIDDKDWNDDANEEELNSITIYGKADTISDDSYKMFCILQDFVSRGLIGNSKVPCFCTLQPGDDLENIARKVKELFYS